MVKSTIDDIKDITLERQIRKLAGVIDKQNEVIGNVGDVDARITAVEDSTANNTVQINSVKEDVSKNTIAIANISNRVTNVEQSTEAIPGIQTEIDGINKSLVSNVTASFDNPSRTLMISVEREASPSIDASVVIPASSETGQYSEGNGIKIQDYQISVDTAVVALKTDIPVVPDVTELTQRVTTLETEMPTKASVDSVNALEVTVNSNTQNITTLTESVNGNTQNITNLTNTVAGKVAISQGAENAGKVLGIGSDGNVTPVNAGGSSGGSGWETLDLSNLPTDFSDGDTLLIDFKCFSSGTATSWTSAISNLSINSQAENISYPILVNLIENAGSNVNCNKIINISSAGGYESYLLISIVYPVSTINSGGSLLRITASAFNGAGPYRLGNTTINRTNISEYIRSIKRLKASA